MTTPFIAAAAYVLLLGHPVPPPTSIPLPVQHPRLLQCQNMDPRGPERPQHARHERSNHLTVRLVRPHEYYDRGRRHRHHHEHFEDQG